MTYNKTADEQSSTIINLFNSGYSVNKISKITGFERSSINLRLKRAGIKPRNQSEAEYLKWSQMTSEQRAKQVSKAHEFRKGKATTNEWFIKQAKSKFITKSKVGAGEAEFIKWVEEKGLKAISQAPVFKYNIDILVDKLAVEIHVNTCNPHTYGYFPQRIIDLLNSGFDVLYIKVTKGTPLSKVCADYAMSFIEFRRKNPTASCQYRVIRGNSDVISIGELDSDKTSLIVTSS